MHRIDNPFVKMLQTKIRAEESTNKDIKDSLYKLGEYIGEEIIGQEFVKEEIITTPLDIEYEGLVMMNPRVVILSTRDDYNNFAEGISSSIENSLRGYMDFGG